MDERAGRDAERTSADPRREVATARATAASDSGFGPENQLLADVAPDWEADL